MEVLVGPRVYRRAELIELRRQPSSRELTPPSVRVSISDEAHFKSLREPSVFGGQNDPIRIVRTTLGAKEFPKMPLTQNPQRRRRTLLPIPSVAEALRLDR